MSFTDLEKPLSLKKYSKSRTLVSLGRRPIKTLTEEGLLDLLSRLISILFVYVSSINVSSHIRRGADEIHYLRKNRSFAYAITTVKVTKHACVITHHAAVRTLLANGYRATHPGNL